MICATIVAQSTFLERMMASGQADARESQLGLIELVSALREEIEAAQAKLEQSGAAAMFSIKGVEAEVHFVADKTTSGNGGFNVHFFAAEAKRDYRSENVHKLKILLEAQQPIAFADGSQPARAERKKGTRRKA